MVRKRIHRILSGGAAIFIVLFCTMTVNGQFGGQAITYTVSGSTGVGGVTMAGLPGQGGQTVVTDGNGYYSATVNYGWKGTVRPVMAGWTFEPAEKTYPKVTADMTNEIYAPSPITYTISGKVANMEGVEMRGLPGNPITGPDGSYSATVDYGWGEMVTPVKEGYAFTPSNKGFPPVKSSQTQNYTAEALKLLITGLAGVEGAVMRGLPGNPVTGKDGSFSVNVDYGWSGTVSPEKQGYEFEPVDLSYPNTIANQTNQNFNARVMTYVISGTTGMAGVEMRGLPGNPYTDESGFFTATVNYGFSATVTPVKAGYEFNPATSMFAKVNSDRTNVSFSAEAIKVTISGTTRLEGVEMNGLPGNPITGKDGSYSVTAEYGWSGAVTPIKEGYEFTPESRPYPSVTADMANQTYSAARITYTISGSAGGSGVTIQGLPGKAVMTTADGGYTATVDYGWNGTITPMKDGYEFEPANMQIDSMMGPLSGQNFTPTLLQRKIAGTIRTDQGQPVDGVTVLADNNGGSAVTGASGDYELSVGHGWSGKLTPLKEGYTFRSSYKPYARVTSDQLNQAFTAIVQMLNVSGAVILGGVPIDGVLITANNGGGSATTDANGKYSLQVPYGWSGDITPTKEGIGFNPPSLAMINVTTDMVDGQPKAPKSPPVVIPRTMPTQPEVAVSGPPAGVVVPGPTPPAGVVVPGPTPPASVVVPSGTPPVDMTPKTDMQRQVEALQAQLDEFMKPGARGSSMIPTGPALQREPGDALISNSWLDDDLVTAVLPDIAAQTGVTIIPDEVVAATSTLVTATLTNVPLDQALAIVLGGTSFVVKKTPFYYLIASTDMKDGKWPIVSETRHIVMNYITAPAAVELLSTAFKPFVQAETPTPGSGTETYAVVITAPPIMMNRIVADLKLIDRQPAHVLLDARIVVMEKGDLLNLGVEWSWPNMSAGIFRSDHQGRGDPLLDFAGKSPWGIQMGYSPDAIFTNALEMTLNLLAQNGEATILAKPQVVAQDGKQAQMQVLTEEYYMLQAQDTGNTNSGFGSYSRVELAQIESGTKLTITPHIGDNNDITLRISVEVSDSIPRGAASDLPVVTRRTADNTVRVQDGGTVALAGLTENRTRTDNRRTPGLSNLPLVGALFKNTNNQSSSREIAVFITAHIMDARRFQGPASTQPSIGRSYGQQPTNQGYTVPSAAQDFGRSPVMDQGFNRTSVDQGFNRTPVDQGFNRTPVDQGFNQTPVNQGFNRPPQGPAPVRPMGDDFRSSLRESLTRNPTR